MGPSGQLSQACLCKHTVLFCTDEITCHYSSQDMTELVLVSNLVIQIQHNDMYDVNDWMKKIQYLHITVDWIMSLPIPVQDP